MLKDGQKNVVRNIKERWVERVRMIMEDWKGLCSRVNWSIEGGTWSKYRHIRRNVADQSKKNILIVFPQIKGKTHLHFSQTWLYNVSDVQAMFKIGRTFYKLGFIKQDYKSSLFVIFNQHIPTMTTCKRTTLWGMLLWASHQKLKQSLSFYLN